MEEQEIEWFCAPQGESQGPMPFEKLVAMIRMHQLSPDDLVWRDGMLDWVPAEKASELAQYFQKVTQQSHAHQLPQRPREEVLVSSRASMIFNGEAPQSTPAAPMPIELEDAEEIEEIDELPQEERTRVQAMPFQFNGERIDAASSAAVSMMSSMHGGRSSVPMASFEATMPVPSVQPEAVPPPSSVESQTVASQMAKRAQRNSLLDLEAELELAHDMGMSMTDAHNAVQDNQIAQPVPARITGLGDPISSLNLQPPSSKRAWLIPTIVGVGIAAAVAAVLALRMERTEIVQEVAQTERRVAQPLPKELEDEELYFDAVSVPTAEAKRRKAAGMAKSSHPIQLDQIGSTGQSAQAAQPTENKNLSNEDELALAKPDMAAESVRKSSRYDSLQPIRPISAPVSSAPKSTPSDQAQPISQDEVNIRLQAAGTRFERCYNRWQGKDSSAKPGRLNLTFMIQPSGKPSNISFAPTLNQGQFRSCLQSAVEQLQFPTFSGNAFQVKYPIIFSH